MTSNGSTSTSAGNAGATTLAGTSWSLQAPATAGTAPAAVTAPTLDFGPADRLAGTTGCNNVVGTYTQSGSSLTIELGPMTKRACLDPGAQAQEEKIVAVLPTVRSFTSSATTLTLQGGDGAVLLVYDAVSQDLAGTSWAATGVNNGRGAVEGTDLTGALTAVFGADGTITGSGGCNTFNGAYTSDGTAIAITGLATTFTACEPAVTALEQAYLAALQKATRMHVSGTTLELRDDSDALQVSLRSDR